MAINIFCTMLSVVMVTLPRWAQSLGEFSALSDSGGFLIKDVALLEIFIWSLSEAVGNSYISRD